MAYKNSGLYKRTTGRYRPTETDFHPPPAGYADWRETLEHYLITGGTNGRTQNHIVTRLRNWVDGKTVTEELETLREMRKVDKYIVPKKHGPSVTVWRATSKILEE